MQFGLINLDDETVEMYRPEQPVQVVGVPCTWNGEEVLAGFELKI
ncbi:MAG: hypothetical protein ACFBSC_20250 [Microcoleaceae cyanobacterium]